MEFELWWLLAFPLFFVLGWLAARIDIKHVVKESRALPRTYLTGLNFLLNEQPDKAIDAFIEAVKIDNQTVELHFALGSLFRRRGETDRAIRMLTRAESSATIAMSPASGPIAPPKPLLRAMLPGMLFPELLLVRNIDFVVVLDHPADGHVALHLPQAACEGLVLPDDSFRASLF